MNDIVEKFGDRIGVLGFSCNQFGHQSNEKDEETLNMMKYVRPGNGFEPKFEVMSKVNVNGANAHPLFRWMRETIPIPQDELGDSKGNGCDDVHALILPRGAFDQTTVTLWSPVSRTDIAWNFEKFLIDSDGNLVKRYSRYFPTANISADIEALLA